MVQFMAQLRNGSTFSDGHARFAGIHTEPSDRSPLHLAPPGGGPPKALRLLRGAPCSYMSVTTEDGRSHFESWEWRKPRRPSSSPVVRRRNSFSRTSIFHLWRIICNQSHLRSIFIISLELVRPFAIGPTRLAPCKQGARLSGSTHTSAILRPTPSSFVWRANLQPH